MFYMLHPSKQDESPHDSLLHPLKTGSHRDLQLQTLVDMRGLLTRLRRVDSRRRFSCDEKAPKSRKMFPSRLRFFFFPLFTLSVVAPPEAAACVGGHPHLLKITLFFGLVQTRLKARLLPSF